MPTKRQPNRAADAAPKPDTASWVTLKEASAASDMSISVLRKWYGAGKIRNETRRTVHGNQVFVPLDEVMALADEWKKAQAVADLERPSKNHLAVLGADAAAIKGYLDGFKELTAWVAQRSHTIDDLQTQLAAEREAKGTLEGKVELMAAQLREAQARLEAAERELGVERAASELRPPAFAS